MECFLLGSGGMAPMPHRLLTSLVMRLNGRAYLFDAGEGAQLGWKKSHIGVRGLDVMAVTHLHADHILGLPGLMMLKAQMEDPGPLVIIGPPGVRDFVESNRRITDFHINYAVHFIEWTDSAPDLAYEDDQLRIFWRPLQHRRFCLGYRVEEHDRPGKFDAGAAERLGVPRGPLWGKLQKGEKIVSERGKEISPSQVLGPPRRGRRLAFVVDTRPTKNIYYLCDKVDIAFMEGMFLPEDAGHAEAKGHMTVVEAARIAERAGAGRLILVHISPRYTNEDLSRLEAAARERHPLAVMGRDLDVHPVPYSD